MLQSFFVQDGLFEEAETEIETPSLSRAEASGHSVSHDLLFQSLGSETYYVTRVHANCGADASSHARAMNRHHKSLILVSRSRVIR